jgi:hypothetical protein
MCTLKASLPVFKGADGTCNAYYLSVEDRDLWNLIDAIKRLEIQMFGLQYSQQKEEFEGKILLGSSYIQAAAATSRHASKKLVAIPIE